MSYRVRGMGMDREIERKINEKYSPEDEHELIEWITSVLDLAESPYHSYPEGVGKEHFQAWLKDGVILCELVNTLLLKKSETVRKPHITQNIKLAAMKKNKEMENIGMFLKAAERYGVAKIDLFQTVCLYESTNLPQVQVALYKLGSAAQANGYPGPVIGVRVAQKNSRDFGENKLREGRSIIGLQMGTNQVASQQGMTPYGLGRQLVSKNSQ